MIEAAAKAPPKTSSAQRRANLLRDRWVRDMVDLVAAENGIAYDAESPLIRARIEIIQWLEGLDLDPADIDPNQLATIIVPRWRAAWVQSLAIVNRELPALARKWVHRQTRTLFRTADPRAVVAIGNHVRLTFYRRNQQVRHNEMRFAEAVTASLRLQADAVLSDAFAAMGDHEVVRLMRTDAAQWYMGAYDRAYQTNADAVTRALRESVQFDESMEEATVRLEAIFGGAASDVERITRTQTQRIAFDTEQMLLEYAGDLVGAVQYVAIIDGRTCLRCGAKHGTIYDVNDKSRPELPLHPLCFVAGTVVDGPRFEKGFAREYVGDVVVITRTAGNQITVTTNHPILTRRGWVAAGELQHGDELIDGPLADYFVRRFGSLPDDQDVPIRIEDFANSTRLNRLWVPMSRPDFHGDGTDGEVCVSYADRFFTDEFNAIRCEQAGKMGLGFAGSSIFNSAFFTRGNSNLGLNRSFASTYCGVGISNKALAIARTGIGHSGEHSSRPVTDIYVVLNKATTHDGPRDAQFIRELLLRFSINVAMDDPLPVELIEYLGLTDRNGLCTVTTFDAEMHQTFPDGFLCNAENIADLVARFPSGIHGSNVVSVDRKPFRGHVYTLETRLGWYRADGVIAKNCRCSYMPILDDFGGGGEFTPGPAPEPTNYETWLRGQPEDRQRSILGKTRFELFRGGASVRQFVNRRGRILRVAELLRRHAGVGRRRR